jgi:hypothetical protein
MHKHSLIFDPLGIPSIAPTRGRSPMTGIWLATIFHGRLDRWLAREPLERHGKGEILFSSSPCLPQSPAW